MNALLRVALLSLGSATVLVLGGAGTAAAELRNGAEVNVLDEPGPIQVGVCGNAVTVLGDADASCEGSQDRRVATGNDGDNEGSLIVVDVGGVPPVQATVCGNAVGALGEATASCGGSQDARTTARARDGGDGEAAIDIDALRWAMAVQIDACGNAVAALGDAEASCEGSQNGRATSGDDVEGEKALIVANVGGDPSAQATVCGNAVGIGGDAAATCEGSQTTGGGTGLQMIACGNAVGVLGEGTAGCRDSQDARTTARDDGDEAILPAPSAQAVVCGNAVGVGGDAAASCEGSQDAAPGGGDPVDGGTGVAPGTGVPGTGVLPASGVLAAGPPPADLGGLAVTGVPHGLVSAAMLLFVLGASVLWASRPHRGEGGRR